MKQRARNNLRHSAYSARVETDSAVVFLLPIDNPVATQEMRH